MAVPPPRDLFPSLRMTPSDIVSSVQAVGLPTSSVSSETRARTPLTNG
jgi:hypothetical protein